ncbi:uncharacterized protein [Linepithema humile]|uniref:uncharacterized protein n=1 Tax=Linepithema humile TaxID=83485 RepID=UPI00351EB18C
MGLEVAPQKTEALFLQQGHGASSPHPNVGGGSPSPSGDPDEHFVQIIPKADRMAAALGRLLPNVGGSNVRVRHLYANVVQSVSLYGALVWADKVLASRRIQAMVHRQQRRLASRIIRFYCTTSFVAATALAGLLPVEFLANSYAKEAIADSATGRWTIHAIQPCLPEWVDRQGRGLEFHLTQVLTGHGCFGDYLCRIDREHTTGCHHCAAGRDSAQHTLAECKAWTGECRTLTAVVGEDLSLPALVQAMLEGEEKWRAASDFCSAVMLQKEEAERIRKGEAEEVDSTPPFSPPSPLRGGERKAMAAGVFPRQQCDGGD